MLRRRSIIGAAVLFALAGGAFATATASAEQRAFTCESFAKVKDFSDAHCTNKVAGGTGTFGHGTITGTTAITSTNENTASETKAPTLAKLRAFLAGIEVEVQCIGFTGSAGELSNEATYAWGSYTWELSSCVVAKPAGGECVIPGAKVELGKIQFTTLGQPAGSVKFTPSTGGEFGNFKLEKCLHEVLNTKWVVSGSFVTTANGATLSTTHGGVTVQNALKIGGQKAGLDSSQTLRAGTFPIAFT